MPSSDSIGQRFTQLIQHLGLSKNAFAQSLDKTATVIQHLVDERNKPGYDLLCKVFDTYPNVSKDWLMQGEGPMMKADGSSVASSSSLVAPPLPPTVATNLFAPVAPAAVAPLPPVAASPVPATPESGGAPVLPPQSAPAAAVTAAPVATPVPATPAPSVASAPDPAYFTVALQTQYLQHQLALAEQRNQHLLEQQTLMQQMVALLQRAV